MHAHPTCKKSIFSFYTFLPGYHGWGQEGAEKEEAKGSSRFRSHRRLSIFLATCGMWKALLAHATPFPTPLLRNSKSLRTTLPKWLKLPKARCCLFLFFLLRGLLEESERRERRAEMGGEKGAIAVGIGGEQKVVEGDKLEELKSGVEIEVELKSVHLVLHAMRWWLWWRAPEIGSSGGGD